MILALQRPAPPDIEWWDAPFLPEKDYDSFSTQFLDESPSISVYVQHPIQIPAPQDKIKVDPKALFLTKKEMKKMRRQRRMAALKDRQDRIKMGLLPPDPPKGTCVGRVTHVTVLTSGGRRSHSRPQSSCPT